MKAENQFKPQEQELESKMQVRFDKSEMDEFYNCFEPMDIHACLEALFDAIPLPEAA